VSAPGLEQRITSRLAEVNATGGYPLSLVCTDQGLLVASTGDHLSSEQLAGLTSLFDDIVVRAQRDLEVHRVDEVTLLDPGRGRLIIRPVPLGGAPRFFLVLQAPTQATWRRNTNRLTRELADLLAPMVHEGAS
jgi:hypothetical protein